MKKLFQSALLAFTLLVTVCAVAVEVGTLIHLDIDSAGNVLVEGKATPSASLSASVAALVRDKDHTAVELKFPEKLDNATLEKIKEACRKAGVSRFAIVVKPAGKS